MTAIMEAQVPLKYIKGLNVIREGVYHRAKSDVLVGRWLYLALSRGTEGTTLDGKEDMRPIQDLKQGGSSAPAPVHEGLVLPPLAEEPGATRRALSEPGARVKWHIQAHQHSLLGALGALNILASGRGLQDLAALAGEVYDKAVNETPYLLGTRTPEEILAALRLPFDAMHRELGKLDLPEQVVNTISDLLDTAAVEMQRLEKILTEPELREEVELEPLVWGAWHQAVQLHPHKRCERFRSPGDITFDVISTHHAIRYPASAYDFYLLCYNLVSNAVEAMDRGRITVRLANRPDQGSVTLAFMNEGSVISAANLEKMRTRTPFSTKGSGGGRGMSIIYDIVDRYGGSLRVQSDAGRRLTSFVIQFPES